jgi:hypothetical protein
MRQIAFSNRDGLLNGALPALCRHCEVKEGCPAAFLLAKQRGNSEAIREENWIASLCSQWRTRGLCNTADASSVAIPTLSHSDTVCEASHGKRIVKKARVFTRN